MTNSPALPATFQNQTFDSLSGLRFILALWIAVFHFGNMYEPAGMGSWAIMSAGLARVDVFFVLSGFVLTHIYWAGSDKKFNFGAFLQARIARLVPLHFLALSILVVLVVAAKLVGAAAQANEFTLKGLIANLLLLQSWGIDGASKWNFPAWTISGEFAGYLLFPLFLIVATCFRRAPMLFLVCCLGVLIIIDLGFQTYLGRRLGQSTSDLGSVRASSVMLVGVAGRVLFEKVKMSGPIAMACAICGTIITLTSTFLAVSMAITAFGAVLIIIGLAAYDASGAKSFLNHAKMVELGKWSYGMFILHVPVYMALKHASILIGYELVVNLVTTIAMACLVICVGGLAHYAIEEPARRWIRGDRRLLVAKAS